MRTSALSKDMLPGDADAPNRAHEPDFHENGRIELRFKIELVRLDVGERVIPESAGARHSYDRLILATGSTPRRPPMTRV